MKLPMNSDILPPSDDYVFKTLLTHPDAKPALIDLLSAIVEREVTDVVIRNNELPAADVDEKNERLDVNCTAVDDGSQINVEMQGSRLAEDAESIEGNENFINKYVYYMTDLHSSQKSKGVEYFYLARTYQVTFSMYTIFSRREGFLTPVNLRAPDGELISDQINMIIIELSKLGEVLKKPVEEMTPLEMWSVFLGHADDPRKRELVNEILERKEALGMAGAILATISKDEDEKAKFRSRRKAETDRISDLLTSRANGAFEERAKWKVIVSEKDAEIADKDAAIAGKDAEIAGKDAEIARLRAQLAKSY